MEKYPEIKKLSDHLKDLGVRGPSVIHFKEVSDAANRYALQVNTDQGSLPRMLAQFWGCPEDELPDTEDSSFEASDSWHGLGAGDLREMADELGECYGPFFDINLTAGEIHVLAHHKADPDPAVLREERRKEMEELVAHAREFYLGQENSERLQLIFKLARTVEGLLEENVELQKELEKRNKALR